MVTIQILNKVLATKDISLITRNDLTVEHFPGYEDEFNYIDEHYKKYGNVPDSESFISRFTEFPIVEVTETDKYLLSTLQEEHIYAKSVAVIQEVAELLKTDSLTAVEVLQSRLPELQINNQTVGTDLAKEAIKRFQAYEERKNADEPFFLSTGFPELDDIVYGWARGEDLIIFFARTNQGKSWVLVKTLAHIWELGMNVGYISPEMSATKLGYRFDTVVKNISNRDLLLGREVDGYKQYIDSLTDKPNKFIVATPAEFDRKVTISKLRNFCQTNKLDILGIDGITYLADERGRRGDNKTITLTNISEDLHSLSLELGIPIIAVVQSNRNGVKDDKNSAPELEDIRDSDGISHNATKVIALKQTGEGIRFEVKKNRDGPAYGKVTYMWDIDCGEFTYIPATDDTVNSEQQRGQMYKQKEQYQDIEGEQIF